jgi:hypothetical protein
MGHVARVSFCGNRYGAQSHVNDPRNSAANHEWLIEKGLNTRRSQIALKISRRARTIPARLLHDADGCCPARALSARMSDRWAGAIPAPLSVVGATPWWWLRRYRDRRRGSQVSFSLRTAAAFWLRNQAASRDQRCPFLLYTRHARRLRDESFAGSADNSAASGGRDDAAGAISACSRATSPGPRVALVRAIGATPLR